MEKPPITIVVARAQNGVIGRGGKLPWHISADLKRFKQLTSMSPMQYQKQLRLQHARRLMLGSGLDAAAAAHQVGYESASQFSREYRRLFGTPPRTDIEQLLRAG